MATILEKIQEKYPGVTDDARNIAEALGMVNGTGGRGSGNIADVMNTYVTLTFNPNEGTGQSFGMDVVKGASGFIPPACPFTPPESKVFDFWYDQADASGAQDTDKMYPGQLHNSSFNADQNLYAIWKDAE